MATDRGGLDYNIRARNNFSKEFAQFRAEIRASRDSIKALKTEIATLRGSAKGIGSEFRDVREGVEAVNRARGESQKLSASEARAIRTNSAQRISAQKEADRVADRASKRRITAQKEQERLADRQARLAQRQAADARRAAAATQNQARATRTLNSELTRTDRIGNRVSFTFRRLIGIFAAFAAARVAVRGFTDLVASSIRFSDFIERSALSTGALVNNLTSITDQQGNAVDGAEGFAAAVAEGRRQTGLLQRDSLRTVATLEELQFAFQVSLAPGLSAGLELDEVRGFAVQVSQAATAIGLEQNQLAEEARNILQGTVQGRTTRLAAVFGGSPSEINENIRAAKEQNRLFEFLTENLGGFNKASELAAQTFGGLVARIRDAVQFTGGIAAGELLGNLKVQLADLLDLFITIPDDPLAPVLPKPAVVQVLATVFNGLSRALTIIREQVQSIDFSSFLTGAQGLAGIFEGAASVIGGLLRGLVEGFTVVTRLVQSFSASIGGLNLDTLAEAARVVGFMGTLLITASLATAAIGFAAKLIIGPFTLALGLAKKLATATTAIARSIAAIPTRLLLVVALLTVALTIFTDLVNKAAGFQVRIGTLIRVLREGFFNVLVVVAAQIDLTFTRIITAIQRTFNTVIGFIVSRLREIVNLSATIVSAVSDTAFKALLAADDQLSGTIARLRSSTNDLTQEVVEKEAALADAAAQAISDFDDAIAEDSEANTLGQLLGKAVDTVKDATSGLFDGTAFDFDDISTKLKNAVGDSGFSFTGNVAGITPEELNKLSNAVAAAEVAEAQVAAEQEINRVKALNSTQAQQQFAAEQGKLGVLQQQLLAEQNKSRIALEAGQLQISVARARVGAEEQLQQIEQIRLANNGQITAEQLKGLEAGQQLEFALLNQEVIAKRAATAEAKKTAEIERQKQLLEEQRLILEGSLLEGLGEGFVQFAEQFASAFQAAVNIAKGTIQQLSSFITATIVDGFVQAGEDGNTDDFFDNLEERAGELLKNIASLILQQLIQLAIAKAVLGLSGPSGAIGANSGGQVLSFHEGGNVPHAQASLAHYGIPGPAKPPKGVHRSDNIPAWLGAGEFVEPLGAVKKYGADLFEAFRRGSIDPAAARALLGGKAVSAMRVHARRGMGFQDGGLVGENLKVLSSQLSEGSVPSGSPGQSQDRIVAALPVREQELDRLHNNDQFDNSMFEWLDRNGSDTDSILRSRRRQ